MIIKYCQSILGAFCACRPSQDNLEAPGTPLMIKKRPPETPCGGGRSCGPGRGQMAFKGSSLVRLGDNDRIWVIEKP